MEVKTIRYKRLKNLGNYNNEELEAVAEIDLDDDRNLVIAKLKVIVNQGLGIEEKISVKDKPKPSQSPQNNDNDVLDSKPF